MSIITLCSLHSKAIKYMCINGECSQEQASICDDCLQSLHHHDTQEMVQIIPMMDSFTTSRASDRDRIKQLRADFNIQFDKYQADLTRIFEGELRQVRRKMEQLVANLDIYGGMPASAARDTLMKFRVSNFEAIRPDEFRRFYTLYKNGEVHSQIKQANIESTATSLFSEFRGMVADLNSALAGFFSARVFKAFDPEGQSFLKDFGRGMVVYLEKAVVESERNNLNRKEESHAKRLMKEASQLERAGKHEEALAKYNQVIDLSPGYHKAYNNKGIVLRDTGRIEEAIRAFGQSVIADPLWAEGYINLGICYRLNMQLRDSIVQLTKALDLQISIPALYNRAISYTSCERFPEALADIKRAQIMDPSDQDLQIFEGICRSGLGEYDSALHIFTKVAEKNINSDQAFYNQALALRKLNRLKEAETALVRALSLEAKSTVYRDELERVRRDLRLS
jgi:tetratricopeptide (TPR) repeat protein